MSSRSEAFYHGTATNLSPGDVLYPPTHPKFPKGAYRGLSSAYGYNMPDEVEDTEGGHHTRGGQVWVTRSAEEAHGWGSRQIQKASASDFVDMAEGGKHGINVYRVEPMGPVHTSTDPHDAGESFTSHARIAEVTHRGSEIMDDVKYHHENQTFADEGDHETQGRVTALVGHLNQRQFTKP